MMNNPLGKDFSLKSLLIYTLPSMAMMLLMSTYSVVDGMFVANLVSENALAAVNIIMPLFGIIMAVGLMFATGGNAVIAKYMGQGKNQQAREFLTVLFIIATGLGLIATACVYLFPEQILSMLKVSDNLYDLSKSYLFSLGIFAVPVFYQVFTQSFMATAGKPTVGLVLSVIGGLTNVILDYVLISPNMANLGIAGAGIATGLGAAIPGIIGCIYFIVNKKSVLHFTKPKFKMSVLSKSMFNGSSELVGSLATSITTILFNVILLDMVGDAGVSAISVILYIQMFQNAIYIGYTIGVAPIIAYKYGEENHAGLKKVMKQSIVIVMAASLIVLCMTPLFADYAIALFISQESETFEMAKNGLLLFLPSFIFMGFNIFVSSMFTSLSNGKVSATLAILRSLVFIVAALLILPKLIGLNGVWLALPTAEFLAAIVSIYFYVKGRKVYGY